MLTKEIVVSGTARDELTVTLKGTDNSGNGRMRVLTVDDVRIDGNSGNVEFSKRTAGECVLCDPTGFETRENLDGENSEFVIVV